MSDVVDFIVDHSYVAQGGMVHQQVVGMAMGVNNAPQMANLLCAYYELNFLARNLAAYLRAAVRSAQHLALFHALCNGSRFIDGIGLAGIPEGVDVQLLFRDERPDPTLPLQSPFEAADGMYPTR